MRILVTGSRNWDDKPGNWGDQPGIVAGVLRMLNDDIGLRVVVDGDLPYDTVITLVHGACPDSPDVLAAKAAKDLGWQVESHPADWDKHGKQAGYIRNQEMVNLGADVCLAFIARCAKPGCPEARVHDSHGTSNCADAAERAGITVLRYCQ